MTDDSFAFSDHRGDRAAGRAALEVSEVVGGVCEALLPGPGIFEAEFAVALVLA